MAKKIGIVGGIGWRSTVDYYSAIYELTAETLQGEDIPPIEVAIESLDLRTAASLLADGENEGRWGGFDNYHRAALIRLERSEAEIAVMACNTPHERAPDIREGVSIELVDMFEAVADVAKVHAAKRLLILGTPTTIRSRRLQNLFAVRGMDVILPSEAQARELQRLIRDLQRGSSSDLLYRLLDLVHACGVQPGSRDFVALQCTELPLAFPRPSRLATFEWEGVHFLNPSMAHVQALLGRAGLNPRPSKAEAGVEPQALHRQSTVSIL